MASAVIYETRSNTGEQTTIRRINEKNGQTFLLGVPVQVTAGSVQEWDGTTIARGVAGVSKEAASNLTTTGVAKTLTFGVVPNQAAAANIPRGAPLNDGRLGLVIADDEGVFYAQVGPSQTTAATDVGVYYGMTKDTDGHWFIDKTKTTQGTNTVAVVVKLDPFDTTRGVHIRFQKEAQQEIV